MTKSVHGLIHRTVTPRFAHCKKKNIDQAQWALIYRDGAFVVIQSCYFTYHLLRLSKGD